jgi:hypothetical protein
LTFLRDLRRLRTAVILVILALSAWPLSAQPTARVSGRLAAADGRRLVSAAVMLTGADDSSTAAVPPEDVTILPDGRFTFGRVPPGRYQIRARAQSQPNGTTMFATFGLAVEGRDIANVAMMLEPGALLDGRLDIENRHRTAAPPPSTLTVRAPLTDGSGFGDALTGGVRRDGTFAIRGLVRGVHHVTVEGLGDQWTVKSVTIRGRDITDQPFDVAGVPLSDVRVTIVDAVSELAGEVRDEQDRPAADVPVLTFAVAPQFWIRDGRRLRLVRTDDTGRFQLRGLPPGAYLAIASASVSDAKGRVPQNLEQFRASATRLDITETAAKVTVSLRLADRPGRQATTR